MYFSAEIRSFKCVAYSRSEMTDSGKMTYPLNNIPGFNITGHVFIRRIVSFLESTNEATYLLSVRPNTEIDITETPTAHPLCDAVFLKRFRMRKRAYKSVHNRAWEKRMDTQNTYRDRAIIGGGLHFSSSSPMWVKRIEELSESEGSKRRSRFCLSPMSRM
jgi:hypothetical protein